MRPQRHTPEPWHFDALRQNLADASGESIFHLCDDEQYDANYARIVDCVNAMAGIADPTATLKALVEAAKQVIAFDSKPLPHNDEWKDAHWAAMTKLHAVLKLAGVL